MTSGTFDLAAILAPVPVDRFVGEHLGKKFLYCGGQRGRFAALLPWQELNGLLRHHRLDVPRLRLVREGKPVPVEKYLSYRTARRPPYGKTPQLRSAGMTNELRDGATLIVDLIDEMYEPITELAEGLEAALESRIQINMYAGWRHSRGFDLHWDDHDVLILQISGRKEWKVYSTGKETPSTPLWEGLLEDGDMLYIPRGWWHVALPLDEPTLHLTVGLHHRRGSDLLAWFQERIKKSSAISEDVPRFASAEDKAAYAARIAEEWTSAWHSNVVDEFLASADERTEARPRFSLPWSAAPEVLPPIAPSSQMITWTPPRFVTFPAAQNGVFEFRCLGKSWKFAERARPILEVLRNKRQCGVEDLRGIATANDIGPEAFQVFLKELAASGLCAVDGIEPAA